MVNKYPVKFVARAILKDGRTVQFFPSLAFVKITIEEENENCGSIKKYLIDYCEKYGDPNIEDYPYETGYYYGEVFDDENSCKRYVEDLNIRFPFYNKRELAALKKYQFNANNQEKGRE